MNINSTVTCLDLSNLNQQIILVYNYLSYKDLPKALVDIKCEKSIIMQERIAIFLKR